MPTTEIALHTRRGDEDQAAAAGSAGLPAVLDPTLEFVQNLAAFERVAHALAQSGMVKDRTPEAVLAKMMKGRELGLPAFAAQEVIYFFDGKTTVAAHAQLGIASARYGVRPRIVRSDERICEIEFSRPGWANVAESFTLEQAQRAGLTGKDNWKKYPKDMLYSRALTRGIKRICPEVGAGIYDPDEVGATTTPSGEIVHAEVIESRPLSAPRPLQMAAGHAGDAASAAQLSEARKLARKLGPEAEQEIEEQIEAGLTRGAAKELLTALRSRGAEGNGHGSGMGATDSAPAVRSSARHAAPHAGDADGEPREFPFDD
jgi:hypothetical protein